MYSFKYVLKRIRTKKNAYHKQTASKIKGEKNLKKEILAPFCYLAHNCDLSTIKKNHYSVKSLSEKEKKKELKLPQYWKNKPIYQIERVSSLHAEVSENSIQSNYL